MLKMKYMKFISIGFFSLMFLSCSDFLDKNPLDQISSETFWQNEQEAKMALTGVYSRLRAFTFTHKDTEFDIMAGDVCGNQGHSIINIAQGNIYN